MAKTSRGYHPFALVWALSFWAFIVIKFMGSSLAAWSWWWVLLPVVPFFSLVLGRLGLL